MNCFIGLDIGTSAVKGALISEKGDIIKVSWSSYRYYFENNAKLLNPDEFLNACFGVIGELAKSAGDSNRVAAICPCGASGNLMLLGEDDKPITPIIGWQTTIPDGELDEFYTQEEKDKLYKTVGWYPGYGFPVAYLPSIRKHNPELYKKAKFITMSIEYLNFMLSGKWGIGHSMATPFYLVDQEKGCYNKELLAKLDIQESQLPPIFSKGTSIGCVKKEIADKLGLAKDTQVVLGSFDHPSGATGAGVYNPGEMLLSCGTSWVEFFPVKSRDFAISTNCLVDRFMLNGAPYCVMKSITSISDKINNARKYWFGDISHKEFDDFAKKSTLGCDGLRFDFTDNDKEKGKGYEKHHIARAIIESAALILKDNLTACEEKGLSVDKITIIGGITNSAVCTKIIAEALQRPICVINGQDAGAVGAAMLAGIGTGQFENEVDAFSKMNFKETVYLPN